jgi:hypothetical protein
MWLHLLFVLQLKKIMENVRTADCASLESPQLAYSPLVTSDSPWEAQEPAVLPTQVPVPANCESRITVF